MRTRYELWQCPAKGTLMFVPAGNGLARLLLGPAAAVVWSVEAESWEEAQAQKRQFLSRWANRPAEAGDADA
jgi:hypothetical protein